MSIYTEDLTKVYGSTRARALALLQTKEFIEQRRPGGDVHPAF